MAAPVLYQDHLYGPSQTRGELVCLDAKSGQTKWRQKMDATQVTLVGETLVIQCRAGDVQLAKATPAGYKPLGSAHVLDGNECWTPAVVAGGRLFCRSWDGELAALDLSALVPPAPVEVVKASAEMIEKLGARLLAERESAVAKLSAVQGEEAAKLVPLLAEKVRKGTYFEQTSAAKVLLKLGPAAKPAVAELLASAKAAVEGRDWALAEPFIQALLGIDPESAQPVWPAVAALLKDDKPAVRRQALASVARINPPADRSLVEALAGTLADKDGIQAYSAALALANMGQTPGETLSVLTRTVTLRHGRPFTALHALAALGPAAKSAMPDLVRFSAKAEPEVQKAIQAALRKIRTTDVPPVVQDAACTCKEGGFCQITLAVTDEDDVPQAVQCIVVTKPSHGTAVLRGATIEYTAEAGYVGKDELTWKSRDENGQSAVARVFINVQADKTSPTVKTAATTAGAAEDWPCWRGAAGDNNSAWIPKGLPPQATPRWKSPLTGAAHSGVVVSGRCVVVMDTVKDQQDTVRCLSTDTGKELWKHAYPNRGKSIPWGSCPRATPAISGGIVYTLSARGQLFALDLQDGHVLWQKDLTKDFRADLPTWAYCSSPLVVGDRLIVNPGSPRYSLVALDLKTGKTVWSASGAEANYGSYLVAEVQGLQQIIGYDQEEVSGRSPVDGRVIWSKPMGKTPGYLVPSPVVMRDQVLLCGSNGAQLQDLKGARGKVPAAWEVRNKHFKIGDATPTPAEGMALAVVEGKGLTAMGIGKDLNILWQTGDEGMDCHFASVMAGSGRALVLDFAGILLLFDVNRERAKLLGKMKVCEETYAAPALTRGRLYVRDEKAVYCYQTPSPVP
jgi:outer membrane protein assembly factor BamB